MRRTLGTLLLVTVLAAGCGGEADEADDPGGSTTAPSKTPPPETPPEGSSEGSSELQVVDLVSGTAAGGEVSAELTYLSDDAALAEFVGQFSDPALANDVRRVAESHELPDGTELAAAVVALGCDVPPGVDVREGEDGLEIRAQKVKDPLLECFAPVTTVAVVQVPA